MTGTRQTPAFPWKDAMGFGFGVLRLSSRDFWRMTPRELAQAIVAVRGDTSLIMPRTALDDLIRQFPDGENNDGRHELAGHVPDA